MIVLPRSRHDDGVRGAFGGIWYYSPSRSVGASSFAGWDAALVVDADVFGDEWGWMIIKLSEHTAAHDDVELLCG